jgi:hypothetical protein
MMRARKRTLLAGLLCPWIVLAALAYGGQASTNTPAMVDALAKDWLARWERNITRDMKNRYCDRETGEELGWLVSPFLNGFHYGYMATRDTKWIDLLFDWADVMLKRGVKEPDGFIGWPKEAGASTSSVKDFYTDNQLGEAMMLRPLVLMAGVILKDPAMKERYGLKARQYLQVSEQVFEANHDPASWGGLGSTPEWIATTHAKRP